MSMTMDAVLARLHREELSACEGSPDLHAEILREVAARGSPDAISGLLDRALATPRSIAGTVAASRLALLHLERGLPVSEAERITQLERQVLDLEVEPAALKGVIYSLARTNHVGALLGSTWFDELFDRAGTRRPTGLAEANE